MGNKTHKMHLHANSFKQRPTQESKSTHIIISDYSSSYCTALSSSRMVQELMNSSTTTMSSSSSSQSSSSSSSSSGSSGSGSSNSNMLFPYRLQEMLLKTAARKQDDIVSWLPDGKAFKVHKVSIFVSEILPSYFNQSKYKSFQRQLNLWGFERIAKSGTKENGGYYHKQFLRDQPSLAHHLTRQKTTRNGSSSGGSSSGSSSSNSSIAKRKLLQGNNTRRHHEIKPTMILPATATVTTPVVATAAEVVNVVNGFVPSSDQHDSDVVSTSAATEVTAFSWSNNDNDFESMGSSATEMSFPHQDDAVDFEGCTFFPLEWDYYQEMNRRVTKVMDGTAIIVKPDITTTKVDVDDMMVDVVEAYYDNKEDEEKVLLPSATTTTTAAKISNRRSLVVLN